MRCDSHMRRRRRKPGGGRGSASIRNCMTPPAAPRNIDYWYCGHPALRPVAASDDGVHTRLRFAANAEMPAIFVRNDDGSESLLNFSMDAGDVIVHRVAKRFILRRGTLTGCIVNQGFAGAARVSNPEPWRPRSSAACEGRCHERPESEARTEVRGERDATAVNRRPRCNRGSAACWRSVS